jgi:hypothetical protein
MRLLRCVRRGPDRLAGMVAVCLCVGTLTGCGTGSQGSTGAAPLPVDLRTCLERANAEISVRIVDSASKMVQARFPNGDEALIGRLPASSIAERTAQAVREVRRREGLAGIVTSSTLDKGSIIVIVIGQGGVRGGMPQAASEQTSRRCALVTGGRIGDRASTISGAAEI